jgi:hypothetical protein
MVTDAKITEFIVEFTKYIGHEYLAAKSLKIDLDTRFDQLNFDLVDEVVTEHMLKQIFAVPNWTQDMWPETLGSLISLIPETNSIR